MAYRERNDLASVISEIHTKFADLTPEEAAHRVLTSMGFTPSDRPDFSYQKETSSALNFVNVEPDSIYMKVYAKNCTFADSGSVGPPLPNVKELIDFIEFEIG